MDSRFSILSSLLSPSQREEMGLVRDALLEDPTSLDNRHLPEEGEKEEEKK